MNRLVSLVVVVWASSAYANPAAEKAFQDGRAFMIAGKFPEACDAFRRSQDLEPRAGTLLNLADCEEKRGRIATAWEAFVQTGALAREKNDTVRATEAGKREKALAAKLPYLTVKTPATKPDGFAVKRDGKDVPAAELDHEAPIDPAKYELEASAPGHITWKQSITVGIGAHASIEIPALAVDPASANVANGGTGAGATGAGTTGAVVGANGGVAITEPAAPTKQNTRHFGIGPAIGFSTDGDLLLGGRAPLFIANAGTGTLRALASFFYADVKYDQDPDHHTTIYAPGLGVEYVAPLTEKFSVAAGVGLGVDFIDDNYEGRVIRQGWGAVRLSPTLQIHPAVDLGLHLQGVVNEDGVVGLAELGIDYFFF